MRYSILLIASLLIACGADSADAPAEPALYDYSIPEEAEGHLLDAADVINEAAGCTLVGPAEPGAFVNPIIVLESHAGGSSVVGCAFVGEALRRKENPRDTILVEWILSDKAGVLTTAHEIGHTLGLLHTSEAGIMYPVVSDNLTWADSSKAQLQALCDAEDGTQALRVDELVIDHK